MKQKLKKSKEKNKMKNTIKSNKGITLIALVITIIVLLILAGVTIAMLSGENGILSRATETRSTNAEAQADEQAKLAYMGVRTEIIADLTKDFEFQINSEVYGIITDEFGEVVTEKSSWFVVYKADKEILEKNLNSNRVIPLYLALINREDLMLRRESKYIIRARYSGYGTDEVIDSKFKKIGGVSSSCPSLDDIFKRASEIVERPSCRK